MSFQFTKRFFVYLYLIVGSIFILFPMYLTVSLALKKSGEISSIFSPPSSLYIGNFINAIEMTNYFRGFYNSFIITGVSIIFIVVIGASVSYGLARSQTKLSKILYYFFVSGMFVPFQVLMLPLVKQLSAFGMLDKFGLILLYVTYSLFQSVFLYMGYLKSVPLELEEAAKIDGCGIFRTFWYVIFPLLKPMTATIIILNVIWIWNDFLMPLVILSNSNDYTLPLLQYVFQSQYSSDYNLAFASYLLVLLPVLIVYLFMQRYIIGGVTQGSVK